jgi:hypothetical protein
MIFVLLIINPIIGLVLIILAGLLYIIKNVLDWIVLRIIIGPCARVPSSNTAYAKRIKGPGISRDFYCSIESEHLSLLVLSYLEQLRLQQLKKETLERLNHPSKHIIHHTGHVLGDFTPKDHENKFILDSKKNLEYLTKSLEYLIEFRIQRLPKITGGKYTVRFTEESLQKNLNVVMGILSEVVEEYDMDYYIWDDYKIKKGHFNKLSRAIFSEVLTPSALISVESVDRVNKVKYNKTKVVDYVSKVIDDYSSSNQKKRIKRVYKKREYHQSMPFTSLKTIFNQHSVKFDKWHKPFIFPLFKDDSTLPPVATQKVESVNPEKHDGYLETASKDVNKIIVG